MQKEILIRYERCLGCRSCELACAVAHTPEKTLLAAVAADPPPRKRLFVEQVESHKLPFVCRHCEEPYCVDACISGAMHRRPDGVVTNEGGPHPCVGCWMCVMVCPYGVIRADYREREALKCDRACLDEAGVPACVAACPTKALVYTTVDEFGRARRWEYAKEGIVPALSTGGKQ